MKSLEEIWSDPAMHPPSDPAGCPSGEVLTALANGALPLAERERLVDHVVECSACAAALQALRALGPWALAAEERLEEVAPTVSGRRRGAAGWAAAAAVLAAVLGWVVGSASNPNGGRGAVALAANPPIVDLLAEGALRASAPPDRLRLDLPARGGAPLVLVLHLDRPATGGLYIAEFRRGEATAARLEGLVAGPFGTLSILLGGEGLAAGDYEVVVRPAQGGGAEEAITYRIQLAQPD